MKIILGSQSIGRRNILASLGYEFEVLSADIDEKALRSADPSELTLALSRAKAHALLTRVHEPAILLTADTVVAWNGQMLEKPRDLDEAREFLTNYHLSPVRVVTSLTTVNTSTRAERSGTDIAQIWFQKIPPYVIKKMIAQPKTLRVAGGISIEDELLRKYAVKIEGTVESIIGLPVALAQQLISGVSE